MDRIIVGKIRKITIGGNDPLKEGFAMEVGHEFSFKEKATGKQCVYKIHSIIWDEAAYHLFGIQNRYLVYAEDINDAASPPFVWDSFEGYQGITLQYFKP